MLPMLRRIKNDLHVIRSDASSKEYTMPLSFEDLPVELCAHIFERLYDPQDFCNLACTCQSLAGAAPLARNYRLRGPDYAYADAHAALFANKIGPLRWLLASYPFTNQQALILGIFAVKHNRSRAMELLNERFSWGQLHKRKQDAMAVVRMGHLSVLQWWYEIDPPNPMLAQEMFCEAIRRGLLPMAKWMLHTSQLSQEQLADAVYESRFEIACFLPILQWLHQIGALSRETIHPPQLGDIFLKAKSDFETMKWMRHVSLLTDQEIRDLSTSIVQDQARFGLSPVAQWLVQEKLICEKDDFSRHALQKMLEWGAETGSLSTLKWLHATFRLTADDILSRKQLARSAGNKGHLPVLMWLHATFHFTGANFGPPAQLVAGIATKRQVTILRWLLDTFY
jgi:hypothetical protein